jgi:hypothetical protein
MGHTDVSAPARLTRPTCRCAPEGSLELRSVLLAAGPVDRVRLMFSPVVTEQPTWTWSCSRAGSP